MPQVRAAVDHDRCAGVTICTQIAPGAFFINDDGQSQYHPGQWGLRELREAADGCPMSAITVVTDDLEVT
ncbi:MAG TPA: ferredoxin [Streptosporangiaceae bacterium]|nr:ferredoxin [Streptosporangiaceae bacterium]